MKSIKTKSFTVGSTYKILERKNRKIKIKGDTGKVIWTSTKRFLDNKAVRILKLKQIDKQFKLK